MHVALGRKQSGALVSTKIYCSIYSLNSIPLHSASDNHCLCISKTIVHSINKSSKDNMPTQYCQLSRICLIILFAAVPIHWNSWWNCWNTIYQNLPFCLFKEQPLPVIVRIKLSARLGAAYMMFVAEQPETVNKKCIDEVMMEAQGRNYFFVLWRGYTFVLFYNWKGDVSAIELTRWM